MKILLSYKDKIYRFLNISFNLRNDGSLYLIFDRKNKKKISYHPSGQINYQNHNEKIFQEPLYKITEPFELILISIPEINKLDIFNEEIKTDDFLLPIDYSLKGRLNFHIFIKPFFLEESPESFSIKFFELFGINIFLTKEDLNVSKELENHFIYLRPLSGKFSHIQVSINNAIWELQKIANKKKDLVIYSPTGEGIAKMFFTEKRIAPKLEINFVDDKYELDTLENNKKIDERISSQIFIKFRIRERKSKKIIKNFIPAIKSILLDAEL